MQVRGKVATCLAASAAEMRLEDWQGYPAKQLLVVAGKLVSDNTPEARDSAKSLIAILRGAFEGLQMVSDHEVGTDAMIYWKSLVLSSRLFTASCFLQELLCTRPQGVPYCERKLVDQSFQTAPYGHTCTEGCAALGVQASDKENDACGDTPVRESAGSKAADAHDEVAGSTAQDKWARHCHSTLGAVAAAPILKASNCS